MGRRGWWGSSIVVGSLDLFSTPAVTYNAAGLTPQRSMQSHMRMVDEHGRHSVEL